MKIKLDNMDKEDGSVLVIAEDADEAREDQSIEGSHWECDGDFAYAIISDRPGLVAALEKEGYEVDTDEFYEHSDDEFREMAAKWEAENA